MATNPNTLAPSASSSGIQVNGVSRAFGQVLAVRDATLTVPAGSVTGLIGPNGSGKTTLMLMLATLLPPDTGSILINGNDPLIDPRQVRRSIGWMPDVLGSWATISVRRTVETTGRMYELTPADAADRADELLALVGLLPLAQAPTRVLSRGQKQRLSLARALVHRPSVLLLDEPASGLDPAARADLRTLVRRLAGEGCAILVSSHVLSELEEMADAAVYMTAGVTAAPDTVAKAGSSLRQWRIRALDRAGLPGAIAAAGVHPTRISMDNLGVLVTLAGEGEAASLLGTLVASGVQVSTYGPAVGDLEHTFLDLNRPASSTEAV